HRQQRPQQVACRVLNEFFLLPLQSFAEILELGLLSQQAVEKLVFLREQLLIGGRQIFGQPRVMRRWGALPFLREAASSFFGLAWRRLTHVFLLSIRCHFACRAKARRVSSRSAGVSRNSRRIPPWRRRDRIPSGSGRPRRERPPRGFGSGTEPRPPRTGAFRKRGSPAQLGRVRPTKAFAGKRPGCEPASPSLHM